MSQTPRDFGTGALSEITSVIYWYLVVGLLFILVTVPGTIPMMFLERHISNAPLYALFMLPIWPALSAVLFALDKRRDAEAVTPAQHFFRGYKLNLRDSLKVGVPGSIILTILAINLAFAGATGLGSWYPVVGILLTLLVMAWLLLALVIVSLFSFRARDVIRLSVGFLFSHPMVTLGIVGVVVITTLVVTITFDAVAVLFASLIGGALLWTTRAVHGDITRQFVRTDPTGVR